MAKQSGIIKLNGTIDDISFYKTADGHLARAKGGVSRNKILNDPAFQRTRENGMEFGTAGKGGKVIRNGIRHLLQNAKDRRVVPRLSSKLLAVIKTDPINPRGRRTIQDGNMSELNGFDFNANASLNSTLFVPYETDFDRASGEATVAFEAFAPTVRIAAPQGTTHIRISAAALEVDFENQTTVMDSKDTGLIEYDSQELPATVIPAEVTPGTDLPVFQLISVEFYQMVNGDYYPLKNGAHNALSIVQVNSI